MRSNRKAEFDAVYEMYHNSVYQVAAHVTNNLHTAEDITQDVFLKYYLYTASSEVKSPKTFLLTLSNRLSLNYLRDNKYETVLDMEEHEEDFPDEEANPESIFFKKLWSSDTLVYSEVILDALKKKNESWYDAVTYVYGMARKRKDVAEAMGISVTALDGLLKRAKNWIEENYRNEHDHINCK